VDRIRGLAGKEISYLRSLVMVFFLGAYGSLPDAAIGGACGLGVGAF